MYRTNPNQIKHFRRSLWKYAAPKYKAGPCLCLDAREFCDKEIDRQYIYIIALIGTKCGVTAVSRALRDVVYLVPYYCRL